MGLFQKAKQSIKLSDDLPQYVDSLLENSSRISNAEVDERFSVKNMSLNLNYGIDHAIELLRSLPSENTDIVVSVVTKTLESANIDVQKIVKDAETKEQSLESHIEQLNNEIKSLQDQISAKKDQINVATALLGETQKVRKLLERSEKKSNANGVAIEMFRTSATKPGNSTAQPENTKLLLDVQSN